MLILQCAVLLVVAQRCGDGAGVRLVRRVGGRLLHRPPPILPGRPRLSGTDGGHGPTPATGALHADDLSSLLVPLYVEQKLHAEIAAHSRVINALDVHPNEPLVGCFPPTSDGVCTGVGYLTCSTCI